MKILGIETSCDETAAAVVTNGQDVHSNIVISSLKEHSKFGGIIPEIASRKQLESINIIVEKALNEANIKKNNIDAVAVTTHPGLIGSLLVGTSFARALSYSLNVPLISVDHIKAHIYANFLKLKNKPNTEKFIKPKLPAIGLVVSGGHTNLYYIKDFQNFKLIGQTLDDAAGEAFDKVARILDLGYPGGPVIDKLAKKGKNNDIHFTCAQLQGTLDFSFSGIKTAVLYHYRQHKDNKDFSAEKTAYAFQQSVVTTIVQKCLTACKQYNANTLLVGGGVAANTALRSLLNEESKQKQISVHYPDFSLCLDNAAMIAGYAYHLIPKGALSGSNN